MEVKGKRGRLLAGYQEAATLRDWQMHADDAGCEVSSVIGEANSFWLEHAPSLDMELELGMLRWRFTDVTISIDGKRIEIHGRGEGRKYV